jgi:predicted Zn finger-like uncharacterized protein
MLLTRCPECDTTFRVTEETLNKASGQVRCGRCASVFNAYAELQDSDAKPAATGAARGQARTSAIAEPQPEPPPEQPKPTPLKPVHLETKRAATEADPGTTSVADVVAETKIAAADATVEARAETTAPGSEPISATEIERVLSDNLAATPYIWLRTEEAPRSRWWTVAVVLAALTLGLQAVHHFRARLAGHPTFGPWVTAAYDKLGVEVTPSWDVHQYEIIDWVATAEPNERGLGSLKITARIQNHGPLRQPYPAVQLRLKDQFESRVGGRLFTPAEYLPRDTPHERLMSPGETTQIGRAHV